MTAADGSSTEYSYDDRGNLVRADTEAVDEAETVRTYAYCSNDPVNYTDSSGHIYKSLYVSERMYSLALSKHKYEIDLARYPALNGALISRFKHSKTFTKFISNELKMKNRIKESERD